MNRFEEYVKDFNTKVSIGLLLRIALLFLIVLLVKQTWPIWSYVLSVIQSILTPFLVGFLIAYILSEPVNYLEGKGIKRSISIPVIYVVVIMFFIWMLSSIVPMVIYRISDLLVSTTEGLSWLYHAVDVSSESVPVWFTSLIEGLRASIDSLHDVLPALSKTVPGIVSAAMSLIVHTVFTLVISIFMCFGWHSIKYHIKRGVGKFSKLGSSCLTVMDYEVGSYIHSLLILMVIRFVEYSIVYFVIGHPDWMILALMTSLSLLIPYLGPTIVNCLGILTALTLAPVRIVILVVLIVILSFVDEYVIAPIVHSHNTGVTPLWTLFSIFAGGTLFGAVGIIAAVPAYLSIRSIYTILIRKGGEEI